MKQRKYINNKLRYYGIQLKLKILKHLRKIKEISRRTRYISFAALILASILVPLYHPGKSNASTTTVNPNSDVVTQWNASSGTTHYSLIDDGTTPNTSNYVYTGTGGTTSVTDEYGLSGVANVASATQLVINVYAESATNANGGALDTLNINLIVSGTAQTAGTCTPAYATWNYCTVTYTGTWTQANVNAMQVEIYNTINGSGPSSSKEDNIEVADIYGTLTYTPSSIVGQSSYRFFNNQDAVSSFKTWAKTSHVTAWASRDDLASVVYNNEMWIFGGYNGSYLSDVWYSSDGTNWTEATSAAPWSGGGLTALVYNDKMWVMGGYNGSYNDAVWYSTNGVNWTEATAAAGWSVRTGLTSVVYNNEMWVMGGVDGSTYYNDVWYSTDGINWTEATTSAPWGARTYYASLVYNNEMWVMGGYNGSSDYNDSWYSTNGSTWTEANAAVGWSARDSFTGIVYNNEMWVIGGDNSTGTTFYNDVWASSDGANWTPTTGVSIPWAARFGLIGLVYNNEMWVMGGIGGSTYYNDVWYSTNGINWTEATSAAGWSARYRSVGLVYNNEMWVMGGGNGSTYYNDVWYSTNGINWTEATSAAGWSARYRFTGLVYNNEMWVMGGDNGTTYNNQVWYSTNGSTWTEATTAAGWSVRSGMASTVYNNEMWVMGGLDGGTYYNDVWYSTNGSTWTEATSAAAWPTRAAFNVLTYNNEMWVLGGANSTKYNDVWYSSNGSTWTEETSSAAWSARYASVGLVYNNELWTLGGNTGVSTNGVWSAAPVPIDVGSPLAAQNTAITDPGDGTPFRLRIDLPVTNATATAGSLSIKLQYAIMSGSSCSATPSSSYSDVSSYTPIGYYSNTNASSGEYVQPDANDPTDSTNTIVPQTYQQSDSSFTNVNNIQIGQDGEWDFALVSNKTLAGQTYCLQVVNSNGSLLGGTYSDYPEIVTPSSTLTQSAYRIYANKDVPLNWSEATAAAAWPGRSAFTGLVYDNKMWVMGGYNGTTYYNDVWYSTDGVNWTEATAAAPWAARNNMVALSFDNKMWVMGGYNGSYYNDVWYSTDGVNWTEATAAAPWAGRAHFTAMVYNNEMWLMGGTNGTSMLNDVWYSTDGVNWTEATSAAAWPVREGQAGLVFGGKMWIMGGENATTTTYYNDVWYSTDGVNWTEATAAASWATRYFFGGTVYNNEMWIMGGQEGSSELNDVWYSTNGVNWTEATTGAGWAQRFSPLALNYNNEIWAMGGGNGTSYFDDVWYNQAVDVGTPLDNQNTVLDLANPALGQSFRLRLLVGVSGSGQAANGISLNLQYAIMSGSCSATPSTSYYNVSTTTPIQFYTNTYAANGDAAAVDANDPTDGTNTIVNQTYQQANPITNTSTIYAGEDGLWDISLIAAPDISHVSYCLRTVVSSTGSALNSYLQYPMINISPLLSNTLRQGEWWNSQGVRQPFSLQQ